MKEQMPVRLSTTVSKITSLPNSTNAALMIEFYQYMKNSGASESHTNNSLKTSMAFAKFLGPDVTFYDIQRKEEIIAFLDTKIKSLEEDPDKKCIITWNDYLGRIKYFMRWLYNYRENNNASIHQSDWITPPFLRIKEKKTKRESLFRDRTMGTRGDPFHSQV